MSTLAELRTLVSADLRDPDGKVFTSDDVDSMINSALVEIGRIAPARFQEDLDPVENQFEYQLLTGTFSSAVPEIEVTRVEMWDATTTPIRPLALLAPASQGYINFSNTGWSNRDGILELAYDTVATIGSDITDYLIRVWGYTPYAPVSADGDNMPVSGEREQAIRDYVMVLALRRLITERDLFTQWQTRPGNSDVSPAALLSALREAQQEWKARSRSIMVLREAAG